MLVFDLLPIWNPDIEEREPSEVVAKNLLEQLTLWTEALKAKLKV